MKQTEIEFSIKKEFENGVTLTVTHGTKYEETEIRLQDGNDKPDFITIPFSEVDSLIEMLQKRKELMG
jgi:hypothetical protein